MQEHRIYKALKKWRAARKKKNASWIKRQRPTSEKRDYLLPFAKGERKLYPHSVIGYFVCRYCGEKVQVVNDRGIEGWSCGDRVSNHESNTSSSLCEGSEKMIHDFLGGDKDLLIAIATSLGRDDPGH